MFLAPRIHGTQILLDVRNWRVDRMRRKFSAARIPAREPAHMDAEELPIAGEYGPAAVTVLTLVIREILATDCVVLVLCRPSIYINTIMSHTTVPSSLCLPHLDHALARDCSAGNLAALTHHHIEAVSIIVVVSPPGSPAGGFRRGNPATSES